MPEGKEVFLGLNQTGVIVFIVLLVTVPFLCWLPFIIDNMKSAYKEYMNHILIKSSKFF